MAQRDSTPKAISQPPHRPNCSKRLTMSMRAQALGTALTFKAGADDHQQRREVVQPRRGRLEPMAFSVNAKKQ